MIYKKLENITTITAKQYEQALKKYPTLSGLYALVKDFYGAIFSKKPEKDVYKRQVSFPAGKYGVFSLDIATSASAMGKILMYAKEDKSIPIGWAMDENGQDTTSSSAAVDAFKKGIGILPMAGHKGMGLAMVIDVLAGLLSGASLSYQVSNSFAAGNVSGVGFFCLVLDIKRFMPLDEFQSKLETWFDILKADKVRTGTSGIFIPGEIEQNHAVSTGDSLDVLSSVIKDIEKIEAELGLEKQTTAI